MALDIKKIALIAGVAIGVIAIFVAVLVIINKAKSPATETTTTTGGAFGSPAASTNIGLPITAAEGNEIPAFTGSGGSVLPVFKIAEGPVISSVLLEATSTAGTPATVARYVTAQDGHVLEVQLDVAGAAPHIVSNTTIPGVSEAIWTEKGLGVIVRYADNGIIKSAHLALPTDIQGSSGSASVIRFLPDNTSSIAPAPDGSSIVYLLSKTGGGTDGFIAKPDGTGATKLFTSPLKELVVSWPATSTIFFYSKSASNVEGMAFSANTKTGAVTPLLYGVGLTASAAPGFASLLYRTDNGSGASLFAEQVSSGSTAELPRAADSLEIPLPESCVWSTSGEVRAYCAAPAAGTPAGYLDLFHQGVASIQTALVSVNPISKVVLPVATPGSKDGGEAANMILLSISPSGHYISFIAKDSEALWGIRVPNGQQ